MNRTGDKTHSRQPDIFGTTSWTAIAAAQSESPEARAALERLCGAYWFPLYAYVRHRGYNQVDAEDLTQGFFHFFLENKRLQIVDRTKGKFRAFLLAAMNGYLANFHAYVHAAKRGGGKTIFSMDEKTAEERLALEPASDRTPEKLYERHWAAAVLERAMTRLADDFAASGKTELFAQLKRFLTDEAETSDYDAVATELGMKKNAVAVAVHRLRSQYRNALREEIVQTVGSQEEVEEEMRHLFSVLAEA